MAHDSWPQCPSTKRKSTASLGTYQQVISPSPPPGPGCAHWSSFPIHDAALQMSGSKDKSPLDPYPWPNSPLSALHLQPGAGSGRQQPVPLTAASPSGRIQRDKASEGSAPLEHLGCARHASRPLFHSLVTCPKSPDPSVAPRSIRRQWNPVVRTQVQVRPHCYSAG